MTTPTLAYKQAITELIETHGDYTQVPKELWFHHSEILRAHLILQANPEAAPAVVLRQYGVTESVAKEIIGDIDLTVTRRQKRSDKYQSIIDWCETHAMEQVTPENVAEVGNVSYSTAIKFIKDRVDLFRRVKRGVYEVRDFRAERAAERG
jgi:hypothetical protein